MLDLGGLYVLGTERHESRRIDNQLRGRSGRQGDPGESRFYLSLEDDLMSRFATGAMNWVMDKALPEDVPIEAGMVTKAIERAQNTVEQRNAETRKNVLKYDEVMNAQRKVVYQRRSQILDGADLNSDTLEYLESAVGGAIGTHCSSEHPEEWDRDQLATELSGLWPGGVDASALEAAASHDELAGLVSGTAMDHYRDREAELGGDVMRQVERQVMLRLIDQKWRSHLHEMDLLREGIHLRAMGQKDPATEWQREGFDMFGQMMDSIALDFVRYVMHVQLAERPAEDTQRLEGVSADKEEQAPGSPERQARPAAANRPASQAPVVKSDLEKVGRNQPCPCGSGKKYKIVPRPPRRRLNPRAGLHRRPAPAARPPRGGRGLSAGRGVAGPSPPTRGRVVAARPVGPARAGPGRSPPSWRRSTRI